MIVSYAQFHTIKTKKNCIQVSLFFEAFVSGIFGVIEL